ncbi:hypothetical protein [Pantanalinema sp. GBBB05]|uniref:hypothetical protein n=1 Tax=Pantanalinema sp. GBBB05 TaxID=2604139 RepID=UPI001D8F6042|nr:hypothetical protein [Pantanalinema sp. GBBB05]
MADSAKKDNSTYWQKVRLRRSALAQLANPVVMETHGGFGKLYQACYSKLPNGIVFEKDSKRTDALALQRPTWAVYEGDCVAALAAGVGAHLEINLLDVDPYGEPWSAIAAFLNSDRPRADVLHIVVNDGGRQSVQISGGWDKKVYQPLIERFGNGLFRNYLEGCQILMHEKAAQAGYTLSRWHSYYCGHSKQMSHYWAVLERSKSATVADLPTSFYSSTSSNALN